MVDVKSGKVSAGLGAGLPGTLWKHPKTGGYYWSVKLPGVLKRRHIPLVPRGKRYATKIKTIAVACQRRMWKELVGDAKTPPTRSVAGWADGFQEVNGMDASARTARRNADIVRIFARRQNVRHVWEITSEQIQNYLIALQKEGKSPGTLVKHRNAIRKFCRFLMGRGELEANPAARGLISMPRVYARPPRFLTGKQIQRLLRKVRGTPLYLPVVFALRTGVRLGELGAIKHRDIHDGQVTVGADDPTKTYEWRVVPVPPGLVNRLPTGNPDAPLFPQRGSRQWVRLLAELTADLPVFGELEGRRVGNQWHLLRSTFAVQKARQGATLWQLMAWLGHKNPQTTMRYVNIAHAAGAIQG